MPPKSEYCRKFVADNQEMKENYNLLLNFRKKRKSHEFRHTSIAWDDSDDDEDDDKIKQKKLKVEPKKGSKSKIGQDSVIKDTVTDLDKDATFEVSDNDGKEINKAVKKKVALDVPTRKSKRKSSSPRKDKRKPMSLSSRAPLLAYGWADKNSIAAKRTFNMLAPADQVFDSALTAAKQRDARRKSRQTLKEKLEQEQLKRQTLIEELTNFDMWQTEYKKSFCSK